MKNILVVFPTGVEKLDVQILKSCQDLTQTEHIDAVLILETVDEASIVKFKEQLQKKLDIDGEVETHEEDRLVQGLEMIGAQRGDRLFFARDEGIEETTFDRNALDI